MIRYRMKKIIRLLEKNNDSAVYTLARFPKYTKALAALSDIGCVKVDKAWGGDIVSITLLDKSATYQLERYDLWINRIVSFILGVLANAATKFIVDLLT